MPASQYLSYQETLAQEYKETILTRTIILSTKYLKFTDMYPHLSFLPLLKNILFFFLILNVKQNR